MPDPSWANQTCSLSLEPSAQSTEDRWVLTLSGSVFPILSFVSCYPEPQSHAKVPNFSQYRPSVLTFAPIAPLYLSYKFLYFLTQLMFLLLLLTEVSIKIFTNQLTWGRIRWSVGTCPSPGRIGVVRVPTVGYWQRALTECIGAHCSLSLGIVVISPQLGHMLETKGDDVNKRGEKSS